MVASAQSLPLTAASVELQRVNPLCVDEWDELLASHPQATVFHSRAWAEVLAESYGYNPEYFLAADGPHLYALLPLFEVRSWLTGVRGVSLPFTDVCEPLESGDVGWHHMFRAAQQLGRERQWKYLEFRGGSEHSAAASSVFFEHQLDLRPSEDKLFNGCDSAMRRSIRKAERENIELEIRTDADSVEDYYQLHLLTRQKHGIPPQPLRFFRNVYQFLIRQGLGTVLLARLNGVTIAGAIFLHLGLKSVYKFGASDPAFQHLRPNNLLLWRGVLHMKSLGLERVTFGRTSLEQEGLRRFKASFGAEETKLFYFRYNYASENFQSRIPDRSTGIHATLFRHCPKTLSRLAGAAIYPHIG